MFAALGTWEQLEPLRRRMSTAEFIGHVAEYGVPEIGDVDRYGIFHPTSCRCAGCRLLADQIADEILRWPNFGSATG